jgi:iron complex transport system permease protein
MTIKTLSAKELIFKITASLIGLAVILFICTLIGSEKISLAKIFSGQTIDSEQNIDYQIYFGVRLPRVIVAALVGAALGCAGAALQSLLRNPLADPYILGISSGAGLGVITAILSGVSFELLGGSGISLYAFAGSIITVWLVWFISRLTGKSQTTSLLLAGVVLNAFLSAVMMFLISIAKSDQLYSTIFWLMGNISEKSTPIIIISSLSIIFGIFLLSYFGLKLNVMSLGEGHAKSLGINPVSTQIIVFALCAFITSIAVSLSGLIGFVGLVIPHSVRLIAGPDHRKLLPFSAIFSAAFLVISDTIARTVIQPAQIPVGIITAIIGGPFFLFLLIKQSKKVTWLK